MLAGLALTFMTCVTSVVALPAMAHAAAKPPCVGPQCGVTPTPVTADSPVITSVSPAFGPPGTTITIDGSYLGLVSELVIGGVVVKEEPPSSCGPVPGFTSRAGP